MSIWLCHSKIVMSPLFTLSRFNLDDFDDGNNVSMTAHSKVNPQYVDVTILLPAFMTCNTTQIFFYLLRFLDQGKFYILTICPLPQVDQFLAPSLLPHHYQGNLRNLGPLSHRWSQDCLCWDWASTIIDVSSLAASLRLAVRVCGAPRNTCQSHRASSRDRLHGTSYWTHR